MTGLTFPMEVPIWLPTLYELECDVSVAAGTVVSTGTLTTRHIKAGFAFDATGVVAE